MSATSWEPVIGLEIHVQLKTQSKIFSSAAVSFGGDPNSHANLVDVAMPGTLPVLNEEAVRMAVKFGLAINAEIAEVCRFDRKNYFYPDLPKGYQISQLDEPIVGNGELPLILDDGSVRRIGITRAHLEEDAGKSIHDLFAGETGIDLNRAGTPLLEIVTDPDLRSAHEAAVCFRQMHTLVTWLGICDGNLAEGSMRCDANVSVRRKGDSEYGERTEIKNINSFRFVERALDYEISRHIGLLEDSRSITRETRLYDADHHETRTMRGKELSEDYRYFPDPDLLPVQLTEEYVESIRESLVELPEEKLARFVDEYAVRDADAVRLVRTPKIAGYFEAVAGNIDNPQLAANWILGELSAALNREATLIDESPIGPQQLAEIIQRVSEGVISNSSAKKVFEALWQGHQDVDEIIASHNYALVQDSHELEALVTDVIEENSKQIEQLKSGKTKVLGYLVGQVMKKSQGQADPKLASELLRQRLLL